MSTTVACLCALAIAAAGLYVLVLRGKRLTGRAAAPPVQRASLPVGAAERSFLYVIPTALAPQAPLLIVFHGGSGSAEQIRTYTGFGFDELAEAHGYALAYPQGIGGNWNTCQKGRKNLATRRNVDDVGFTRALIAWFASRHGIDRSRVFVAGFSNGGQMCFRLALEMADEIAGFAAMAANRPAPSDSKCPPEHIAVPMMLLNGTADPINPYHGGELSPYGLRALGPVLSSSATAAAFARPGSSCRAEPATPPCRERTTWAGRVIPGGRGTWVEKHTWASGEGDEVVLFTIHGGGHTIAQPRYRFARVFGATSAEIDSPCEIWKFFCTLPPRPPRPLAHAASADRHQHQPSSPIADAGAAPRPHAPVALNHAR